MTEPIMLDTSPLGRLANAQGSPEIVAWHEGMLSARRVLIIPEVADYEVRRNL